MTNLLQQAVVAHQANNLPEAERLYREVITAMPEQADALALLGLVCGIKGDNEEAIRLVDKAVAIDPQSALFRFHQGSVLMNAKKLPEAIAAFRQAVALQPGMAQAYYNLGNALRASNDWTAAIEAYRQAIKFSPNYAEAYNNLALTLVHEKKLEEALDEAKKSVALAPTYGEGWRTLCNIAESVKEYELALHAGEQCIRLMPDNHFAWFGYGVALNRLDRNEEAVEAYKRALALKPERADIWDNLGQTYQSLDRLEEAEATFHKTIEVAGQVIVDEEKREVAEEEYGNRHWHLALMELLRGKYKLGFARYRSRFKDVGGLKRPNYHKPLWQGENLAGKTIVVCDEQGYGDTLMFARYLPLLKKQGARILFSIHPVLKNLFLNWPVIDGILLHGDVIPEYDFYTSVFDLPYRFGTTLETIPNDVPYLPLPVITDEIRLRNDDKKKVGVIWGGSALHSNDARRSVPLSIFAKLFQESGIQFYSLNRDMKPGDAELLPKYPVTDLVSRIKDFGDAAGFMQQLDLIITCDSATAHLAGGMGKQVWTLLPYAPDWRWLTGRDDSPWYPTMRLFRQSKIGDWTSAINEVVRELAKNG